MIREPEATVPIEYDVAGHRAGALGKFQPLGQYVVFFHCFHTGKLVLQMEGTMPRCRGKAAKGWKPGLLNGLILKQPV